MPRLVRRFLPRFSEQPSACHRISLGIVPIRSRVPTPPRPTEPRRTASRRDAPLCQRIVATCVRTGANVAAMVSGSHNAEVIEGSAIRSRSEDGLGPRSPVRPRRDSITDLRLPDGCGNSRPPGMWVTGRWGAECSSPPNSRSRSGHTEGGSAPARRTPPHVTPTARRPPGAGPPAAGGAEAPEGRGIGARGDERGAAAPDEAGYMPPAASGCVAVAQRGGRGARGWGRTGRRRGRYARSWRRWCRPRRLRG